MQWHWSTDATDHIHWFCLQTLTFLTKVWDINISFESLEEMYEIPGICFTGETSEDLKSSCNTPLYIHISTYVWTKQDMLERDIQYSRRNLSLDLIDV